MEIPTLQAAVRAESGKGVARKLRAAGKIPAVAYGKGEPVSLSIDPDALLRLHRGERGWNQPIAIDIDGGDNIEMAILRDVQKHPITRRLLHADFLRIDAASQVLVRVRVDVSGEDECLGLKMGGRLSMLRREVQLTCTPDRIPTNVVADISALNVGGKITIAELAEILPEGMTMIDHDKEPVLSIVGKRGGMDEFEDEPAEEAAEEAEEA